MTNTQLDNLIDTITTNGQNRASKVRDILKAIKDEACRIGEVKHSFFTDVYISANFDPTGLGILEMEGFAICNGQNGTLDARRRVLVGYDPTTYVSGNDYSIMGNMFGEENHTLTIPEMPSHSHTVGGTLAVGATAGGAGVFAFGNSTTTNEGGDEPHNNMQPSIISLIYQRIA